MLRVLCTISFSVEPSPQGFFEDSDGNDFLKRLERGKVTIVRL
jgi:hypothetical protein